MKVKQNKLKRRDLLVAKIYFTRKFNKINLTKVNFYLPKKQFDEMAC